jgi:hypothetical protein
MESLLLLMTNHVIDCLCKKKELTNQATLTAGESYRPEFDGAIFFTALYLYAYGAVSYSTTFLLKKNPRTSRSK